METTRAIERANDDQKIIVFISSKKKKIEIEKQIIFVSEQKCIGLDWIAYWNANQILRKKKTHTNFNLK